MIRIKYYTVYQMQGRQEDILAKKNVFRNKNSTTRDAFFPIIFNSSTNSFFKEEGTLVRPQCIWNSEKQKYILYCSPIYFKRNITVSTRNTTSLFLWLLCLWHTQTVEPRFLDLLWISLEGNILSAKVDIKNPVLKVLRNST